MNRKKCFVTVGTTRFDQLINLMFQQSTLKALKQIGVNEVVLQIGASELSTEAKGFLSAKNGDEGKVTLDGVSCKYFRFKNSILREIRSADLVIGHAGAGTSLEVLQAGKPFIAVINDQLMNNHQSELAEKLAELRHLLYCSPADLKKALTDPGLFNLAKYKPPLFINVAKYLDRQLGIQY